MPASPPHSIRGMRRGISLIAIVVTVMIIAVIAAVAVPYLRESNDEMAAVRTAQILRTLQLDLNSTQAANGTIGFCAQIICPQQLHHLTTAIAITDHSACSGAVYKGADVSSWITAAPYSGLPIVSNYGVWTPLGVIHDSVIRISKGNIELHIDSMSLNAAKDLDVAVDGVAGSGVGQLTYGNTAVNTSGQVLQLAKYSMAVSNSACP